MKIGYLKILKIPWNHWLIIISQLKSALLGAKKRSDICPGVLSSASHGVITTNTSGGFKEKMFLWSYSLRKKFISSDCVFCKFRGPGIPGTESEPLPLCVSRDWELGMPHCFPPLSDRRFWWNLLVHLVRYRDLHTAPACSIHSRSHQHEPRFFHSEQDFEFRHVWNYRRRRRLMVFIWGWVKTLYPWWTSK